MFADPTFTDAQLDDFLAAAREGSPRDRLTALTLANTGLRAGEFAHLRAEWLDDDPSRIVVPSFQTCSCDPCRERLTRVRRQRTVYEAFEDRWLDALDDHSTAKHEARDPESIHWAAHHLDALRQRRRTLEEVREENEYRRLVDLAGRDGAAEAVEAATGLWMPHSVAARRYVPVVDEETRARLDAWFADHDAIDEDADAIHDRVKTVGERAGLDVTPLSLRTAFRRRLLEAGLTVPDVAALLGEDTETVVDQLRYRSHRLQDLMDAHWTEV